MSARTCLLGEQRSIVDDILDKWSLTLLAVLQDGPRRFNELRRDVPAITQKSLSQTLRRLERNGLVERTVLDTRPFAVEYDLTLLGRGFKQPLEALTTWAHDTFSDIREAQDRYDASADQDWALPAERSRVGDNAAG